MDVGNANQFENDDFSGFSSGDIDADFLADEYAPKDTNNETIEPIQKVARNEQNKSLLNFESSLQIGDESPFSILPQAQQPQKSVKNDTKVNNNQIDLKSFLQTPVGSIVDSEDKSNVTGSRLLIKKTIDKAQDKPKPKTNIFPISLNESSSINFDISSSLVSNKNNNSNGNSVDSATKASQFTLPGIPVLSNDQNNNLPPLSDKSNSNPNSKPQPNVKTIKVTTGNATSTVAAPTLNINQSTTNNSNTLKPAEESKSASITVPVQTKNEGSSIKVSIKPRWANKQQSELQQKSKLQQNQQEKQQVSPLQQPLIQQQQSSVQPQTQQQQQNQIQNQQPQQQIQIQNPQQKNQQTQNQQPIHIQPPPEKQQMPQPQLQPQPQIQIHPIQQQSQNQLQTQIPQQIPNQQQKQQTSQNHPQQVQTQQIQPSNQQIQPQKLPNQQVQNINQQQTHIQQSQQQQPQIQNPNQVQPQVQSQNQVQQQIQNQNQIQQPIQSQNLSQPQIQNQNQIQQPILSQNLSQPQIPNHIQAQPQIQQYQLPTQVPHYPTNLSPTQNYDQLQPPSLIISPNGPQTIQQPPPTHQQILIQSNQLLPPNPPPLYNIQPPSFNPTAERVHLTISASLDNCFSSIRRSVASELASVLRSTSASRSTTVSYGTNPLNIDVDSFITGLNNDLIEALSFASPSVSNQQQKSQQQQQNLPFNITDFESNNGFGSVNFNMNLNFNLNRDMMTNGGYQTMLHSFQKEPLLLRPITQGINNVIDQELKPLSQMMKEATIEKNKIKSENVNILQDLLNQVESMRITCKNFSDEIIRELEREELMVASRRDLEVSNYNKIENRLREIKLQFIECETKTKQQEIELKKNSELFDRLKQQIVLFIEKSNRKLHFNEKNGRFGRSDRNRSPRSSGSFEFEQILDEINDIENEIQNDGYGHICGEIESLLKCFQNDRNNMKDELLNIDYFNQQLLAKLNHRNSNLNNSSFIYNQNRQKAPSQYNQNFRSNSNLYQNSSMNISNQSQVNNSNFQDKMADANKRINSYRKQRDDLMQSYLA